MEVFWRVGTDIQKQEKERKEHKEMLRKILPLLKFAIFIALIDIGGLACKTKKKDETKEQNPTRLNAGKTPEIYLLIKQLLNKDSIIIIDSGSLKLSEIYNTNSNYSVVDTFRRNGIEVIIKCGEIGSKISINKTSFLLDTIFSVNNNNLKKDEKFSLSSLKIDEDSFLKFSFHGRKYLYFIGHMRNCTGSGCSVFYHILFDVQNKTLQAFETFKVPEYFFVGDIDGDKYLDFLFCQNNIGTTGEQKHNRFSFQFYSINEKGIFCLQKDKQGHAYFINGNNTGYQLEDSIALEKKYNWPKNNLNHLKIPSYVHGYVKVKRETLSKRMY